MLYGASPFADASAEQLGLRPAMTLQSEIISVQTLQAGEGLGYGQLFRAERAMRVGVVACGYADGYPRHALTGTPVLVNGHRSRTLGRVSMDMLCVDLSECADAGVGSPVVLWGEGLPVDAVAAAAGTSSYELLWRWPRVCGVGWFKSQRGRTKAGSRGCFMAFGLARKTFQGVARVNAAQRVAAAHSRPLQTAKSQFPHKPPPVSGSSQRYPVAGGCNAVIASSKHRSAQRHSLRGVRRCNNVAFSQFGRASQRFSCSTAPAAAFGEACAWLHLDLCTAAHQAAGLRGALTGAGGCPRFRQYKLSRGGLA